MTISFKNCLFQPQPVEMTVLLSPRDAAGRVGEDRGAVVGAAYCGAVGFHVGVD